MSDAAEVRARRRAERVRVAAAVAGAVLALIGVRFLVWPEAASRFFGISARPEGFELHHVVALRDLWLGALAIGLAGLREWRALALWLGLGTLVCFGDAVIVAGATGKGLAVAFHVVSGVVCAALAWWAWGSKGGG
jgi:Domain of unknown function (DUF4267)